MSKPTTDRTTKITELYEQGRKFTEEVLDENKRLRLLLEGHRHKIREIEDERNVEVPKLRGRLHDLQDENSRIRAELQEMKLQFNSIEHENWDFSERYLQVERQNNSLLNLYVASQRLHSTLSMADVVQVVIELVVNLVGSEAFEICLLAPNERRLSVIAAVGTSKRVGDPVAIDAAVASALDTGTTFTAPDEAHLDKEEEPVACVPLKLRGEVLGIIIIRELLSQKPRFEGIDHDLFELLAEHAAVALLASHLYQKAGFGQAEGDWSTEIATMVAVAKVGEDAMRGPQVVW